MPCHRGFLHSADWTNTLRAKLYREFDRVRVHRMDSDGTLLAAYRAENALQIGRQRFHENGTIQGVRDQTRIGIVDHEPIQAFGTLPYLNSRLCCRTKLPFFPATSQAPRNFRSPFCDCAIAMKQFIESLREPFSKFCGIAGHIKELR